MLVAGGITAIALPALLGCVGTASPTAGSSPRVAAMQYLHEQTGHNCLVMRQAAQLSLAEDPEVHLLTRTSTGAAASVWVASSMIKAIPDTDCEE